MFSSSCNSLRTVVANRQRRSSSSQQCDVISYCQWHNLRYSKNVNNRMNSYSNSKNNNKNNIQKKGKQFVSEIHFISRIHDLSKLQQCSNNRIVLQRQQQLHLQGSQGRRQLNKIQRRYNSTTTCQIDNSKGINVSNRFNHLVHGSNNINTVITIPKRTTTTTTTTTTRTGARSTIASATSMSNKQPIVKIDNETVRRSGSSSVSSSEGVTADATSGVAVSAASQSSTTSTNTPPEKLINELIFILESKGGIDSWVNHLTDQQRIQLRTLLPTNVAAIMATAKIPEPPIKELKLIVYTTAIPFVGFGIMDNSILIIAGDAIDTSLGVTLGISTMCAAAIGNIISDVAGIGLGAVVEDFCANYLKLPVPRITSAQRQLRSVRFANQLGCCIGIVVGCIIGMFPLLWIDSNKVQAKKREARLDSIFKDVITQAGGLVGAARICLYLRVDDETNPIPTPDGRYLYIKYDKEASVSTASLGSSSLSSSSSVSSGKVSPNSSTDEIIANPASLTSSSSSYSTVIHREQVVTRKDRFVPVGRGIVSRALLTGEAWNIVDVHSEPDFVPDLGYVTWDDAVNNNGRSTKTMICVPINDSSGRPIAVLQAINKIQSIQHSKNSTTTNETTTTSSSTSVDTPMRFSENDVQILKALASHISVSLDRMYEQAEDDEHEVRLHDTIRILKEYGLAGIQQQQQQLQLQHRLDGTNSTRFSKNYSNRPLFPE